MLRISRIILLACFFITLPVHVLYADWKQSDTLVSIDDKKFSPEDYENWWANWREKDMTLAETTDQFVDWTLLYREAEKMGLFNDPEYQHKINVFLKVRSLLLLKRDEIDSKIDVSEEKLWQRYRKEYSPFWKVNFIFFNDEARAEAASAKITEGAVTVENLHKMKPEEGGADTFSSKRLRPMNTHPEWQEILRKMEKNSFTDVIPWQGGYVILHLLDVTSDDKHDFAKVSETIRRKLWKEEEGKYTNQLIDTLINKYKVEIYRDRVQQLALDLPDDQYTDKPLVKTTFGDVTEKEFMAMLKQHQQFRKNSNLKDDEEFDIKERVLNGIISQTLTTVEALERDYEKEEPFKSTYTFYTRHRLVKMVEEKVIQPEVVVSDKDVQQYYEEHPKEFTTSEVAKVAIIEGNQDELQRIWSDVVTGADFMVLVQQNAKHGSPVINMKVDQMDPVVRDVIKNLNTGEVSQVIPVKDKFALLQLLEMHPAQVISLDHARTGIKTNLQEKRFNETRTAFIKRLRNGSEIQVDKRTWQKLRRELIDNDEREN